MKNWLLPLTVLGLSGLGLVLVSERGREQLRNAFDRLTEGRDPFGEFDRIVDRQLKVIQNTLDQLADALEQPQQMA